jgi:Pentapeptide repeats (8 copies)
MSHFSRRNLKNRSFKNRDLTAANFEGADIRGCNFSGAILSGADFTNARAGLTLRQRVFLAALIAIVAGVVGDLMSRLVFSTVGQPPLDPAAPHLQFLYVMLSLTGFSPAWIAIANRRRFGKVAAIAAGVLSGAVVGFVAGFFCPDRIQHQLALLYQQKLPQSLISLNQVLSDLIATKVTVAVQSTVGGALVMGLLSHFYQKTWFKLVLSVISAMLSYATAVMWGVIASAYFHAGNFQTGILFSLLTLVYLGCTTLSLSRISYEWQHAIGTSFRGAELTQANFDFADLRNTDFSKAIGYLGRNEQL